MNILLIWNGKDLEGNYVPDGTYKAILRVYYDYGNIYKEYSLSIDVYRDIFDVELDFINPYLIRLWDNNQNVFSATQNEIKIRQKYKKDFSLNSEFNSYILNFKNKIIEKRNWKKKPESITIWDGRINKDYADFSIFHYIFAYKSYENKLYEYILPGIFVLPIQPELLLYLNPFILNPNGLGYINNQYKYFDIYESTDDNFLLFSENIQYQSKYYQIYCFKDSIFSSKWQYFKDGIGDISKKGILEILKIIPYNHYCQIIFYQNPIQNFEYLKIYNYPVITIIPIYIDNIKPEIDVDLNYKTIYPDIYYDKYFQKIHIIADDNTFVKEIYINLYLNYFNKKLLIKKWKLIPDQIGFDKNQVNKIIYWYGDTIQNFNIESLENLNFEIEAIDIANNKSNIIKSFNTGIFFREKGEDYICNIPLSKILDKNQTFLPEIKEIINKIIKEYHRHQKKYIYIHVHSFYEGKDNETLYQTEKIAQNLYNFLIKEIPEENVFYRGMGELFPYFNDKSDFAKYRNNRLEIIFSDKLFHEEKDLF
ncbi:MAG: hypothetical protein KatS3mg129_3198 [Leptospiraceae bacterium]|nr:MAG: hypothetical protein KatS3mg129_3198 [Leptospiraceae bacterium]